MDKSKMEESIKTILNCFTSRSEQEAQKRAEEALKFLNESGLKIKGPEHFNVFIGHKVQGCLESIARTLYDFTNAKEGHKADFIFTNYDFLEHNIRELCVLRQGSSCCADKSRHIIGMYLKYAISGEIPDFNPKKEQYWIPRFGDNKMWIDFCDGIYSLYYGHVNDFLVAYQALMKCEIRKYKHTLHRWHIKYKNGEDFEFEETWDREIKNPLKYDSDGDYYVIRDKYIGSNVFEKYQPKDGEISFIYDKCVCVPKNEVEIYSVSEEVMC